MEDIYSNLMFKANVLTLGPGGIKGFLELGALQYLENNKYLKDIKYYSGCSAGAIICFLLVLGYRVVEIITICLNYNILFDIRNINIPDIKNNIGLISNKQLRDILTECVLERFGFNLTMEELYQATGLELTFITVNIDSKIPNQSATVRIDHSSHPDLCSVEAVLLSCNIPFLYYQIEYKGEVYIDGAFGNPYPINVYDLPENYTIGIYITSTGHEHLRSAREDPLFYLDQTLEASIRELRQRNIDNSSNRCLHIPLFGYNPDPVGFITNRKQRISMVIEGYRQSKNLIESYQNYSSSPRLQENKKV